MTRPNPISGSSQNAPGGQRPAAWGALFLAAAFAMTAPAWGQQFANVGNGTFDLAHPGGSATLSVNGNFDGATVSFGYLPDFSGSPLYPLAECPDLTDAGVSLVKCRVSESNGRFRVTVTGGGGSVSLTINLGRPHQASVLGDGSIAGVVIHAVYEDPSVITPVFATSPVAGTLERIEGVLQGPTTGFFDGAMTFRVNAALVAGSMVTTTGVPAGTIFTFVLTVPFPIVEGDEILCLSDGILVTSGQLDLYLHIG